MMREEILETAAMAATPGEKLAALRECVQAATLRSLHESGAFSSLCLTGGAAERFALGSENRAENLEFILVDKAGYSPEKWLFKAQRYLRFMGLDARIAFARKTAFHAGWIKVTGLLAEAGLSPSPADALGFRISVALELPEEMIGGVRLVEAAGECFALRWVLNDDVSKSP